MPPLEYQNHLEDPRECKQPSRTTGCRFFCSADFSYAIYAAVIRTELSRYIMNRTYVKLEVARVFQQPRHQILMKSYDSKKKCHIVSFNDWSLKKKHPRLLQVFTSFLPVVPQRKCLRHQRNCAKCRDAGEFLELNFNMSSWGHATKHWKVKRQKSPKKSWKDKYFKIQMMIRMEEWSTGWFGGKDPGSFEEGKNIDIYTSDV